MARTIIDTLSFTTKSDALAAFAAVRKLFPNAVFREGSKRNNYDLSKLIYLDEMKLGYVAWGGKHQADTTQVYIDGQGCKVVRDWQVAVDAFSQLERARPTRIDIALDTFKGEIDYDGVEAAYHAGMFDPKRGRRPGFDIQGGCDGDGRNKGRTFYVGSRGGYKYFRGYEKGLQQYWGVDDTVLHNWNADDISSQTFTDRAPEDAKLTAWFRCEVEFKRVDHELPWEMLTNPDPYFAGAYPFAEQLLSRADTATAVRVHKAHELEALKLITACRHSYGSLPHTLREFGFSDKQIVDLISNGKMNERIIEAGLIHEIRTMIDDREAECAARRAYADPLRSAG